MDRVLKTTQADIKVTLYVNGVATDATGTPTVTITREDGTAVVTAQATTKPPSTTGVYQYTLTPTHTATLDVLRADWTAVLAGANQTFTTFVEIVGGFLFPLPMLDDSLNRGGVAANYSSDAKLFARAIATEALEQAAHTAFIPHYRRQKLDGWGNSDLVLPTPRVTALRSASVGGVALTSPELAAVIVIEDEGILYRPAAWPAGRRNIEVKWEHGFRDSPADIARAGVLLASQVLADGPFDDRGFAVTSDGDTFRLLTAGVAGALFSIPEAQAALARYRIPVVA